jgi:predicted lipoprotein with Yx(FWY)xxD motif
MLGEVTAKLLGFRQALLWIVAVAAVAVAGCGGDTSSSGVNGPSIGLSSSASLGNFLVSSNGRTLYYFGLDLPAAGGQAAVSNCTSSCLAAWPVFQVDAPTLAPGLSASDIGEFTRTDGTKQTTYKGWPLYFYSGDAKAGDTNGDNLDVWYVIRDPFYSALVLTKAVGAGVYLADPAGRTIYTSSLDTVGTAGAAPVSACTGACLTKWPVFLADSNNLPTGVDRSKLTTFTRPDGAMQSAFDGHPLYFFSTDSLPGDQKGRGVSGRDIVDPTAL